MLKFLCGKDLELDYLYCMLIVNKMSKRKYLAVRNRVLLQKKKANLIFYTIITGKLPSLILQDKINILASVRNDFDKKTKSLFLKIYIYLESEYGDYVISLTSRPREATSVATRIRTSPDLKSSRACSLSHCSL